jgi:hypothetical protein
MCDFVAHCSFYGAVPCCLKIGHEIAHKIACEIAYEIADKIPNVNITKLLHTPLNEYSLFTRELLALWPNCKN